MALPGGGGNNNQGIIITLVAETKEFISSIRNAFNNVSNMAKQFGQNVQKSISNAFSSNTIKPISAQAQALADMLKKLTAQFDSLANATDGWASASRRAHVTFDEYDIAVIEINRLMGEHNVKMREAAKIAVATGQIELKAAQAVLAQNKQKVLSMDEVRNAAKLLEENIKRVSNGEQMLAQNAKKTTEEIRNQGKQSKNTGDILGFLWNRIKAVVASLVVANVAFKFVQFLKDMAAEAVSVSQSLFNFEASIKATQSVLGSAAGSFHTWEETVKRLRKELGIFSEKDIRDAITQTINLTRNLNLGAENIEKIIAIASVLAKTTGVDLNQAISDVTHAMTGSRVVLDKYGLNIRDSDLKARALAMGITEATESMTSQEIAIVTLNEIFAQSHALIDATAGFQRTLAGEIKSTEADIADSKENIAQSLGELNLLFKNLYADFLAYVEDVASELQPLISFIERINNIRGTKRNIEDAIGGPPDPSQFGLSSGSPFDIVKEPGLGSHFGFDYFLPSQLSGNPQQMQAYTEALENWKEQSREFLRLQAQQNAFAGNSARLLAENPIEPRFDPEGSGPPSEIIEAGQKFSDDVDDLLEKRSEEYEDAFNEFTRNMRDAQTDFDRDIRDLDKEFADKFEDANTKLRHDLEDAFTDYQRNLAELDADTASEIEDAEREKNDRLIEIREDYYDALRQLDAEYFFEIFDAVAANDAVAIKRAERQYNLEKMKLRDKLKDQENDEERNYKERLERLKRETEERRRELERRYREELEDIKLAHKRQLEQLEIDKKREKEEIEQHFEDVKDDLKQRYEDEKDIIDLETARRFEDLKESLAKELEEWEDYFEDLIELWEDYFEDLGIIKEKNKDDSPQPPPTPTCPIGCVWSDDLEKCDCNTFNVGIVDKNGNVAFNNTVNNNNTHTIILTSDGTVSDDLLESIAKELGDTFETIILQSGR